MPACCKHVMDNIGQIILLVVLPLAWGLGTESLFALLRRLLAGRKEAPRQR